MSIKKLNQFIDSFSYFNVKIKRRNSRYFNDEAEITIYNIDKNPIYRASFRIMNTNGYLSVSGSYIQTKSVDLHLSMDKEACHFIEGQISYAIEPIIEDEVRKNWSEELYYSDARSYSSDDELKALNDDIKKLIKG
ncbi:hypothetical protein [uncultured Endozoicomonas sp.]|uniref:hypothetical protein n=1 Tax=uncultured Endozoicomonas sp. TaxID=432652 RepID=UPI00262CB221|nr:hypothetical protein [uncultured Endozoicomonas sp.]